MRNVVALATLLVALLSGLAACNQPSTTTIPTATRQPSLPAFSDWRVGYIDSEARVHAVSVDGKHDVMGNLTLQGLNRAGNSVPPATVSPSGTLLAYPSDGLQSFGFAVVDATGRKAPLYEPAWSYTLLWSSDGSHLALRGDSVHILGIADGKLISVPQSSSLLVSEVLGWSDATHLVVIAQPPSNVPTPAPNPTEVSSGGPGKDEPEIFTLYLLDVASGALHPVVTITSPSTESAYFALSPDGQTVLYDNSPFRDCPFIPDVALIDVKTGAVTHLPQIVATAGVGFASVAFLPGTHIIAVSQGSFSAGPYRTSLLDTAHDSATVLATRSGVVAGWVPGTHTLILSTGTRDSESIGQGPYTISAVPDPLSNPQATAIILTSHAMTFPWLGFVKTA